MLNRSKVQNHQSIPTCTVPACACVHTGLHVNRMVIVKPQLPCISRVFPSQSLYPSRSRGERQIRGQQNTGLKESALVTQCLQTSRRLGPSDGCFDRGWVAGSWEMVKKKRFGRTLTGPIPGHERSPVQPSWGFHALHSWSIPFTLCEAHRLGPAPPGPW